jgi:tetratricopeptide (TPR) repeat protein
MPCIGDTELTAQGHSTATNPIKLFVASCLFTGGLAFATDFSRRLFGAGADTGSVLGVIFQAFFAVAAGSTFTSAGREFVGELFSRLRLRVPSVSNVALWASFLFFVFALSVWQVVPKYLAMAYNLRGRNLESVNLREAIDAYQRSISLWPSDADAHFNLGRMYQQELRNSDAMSEYEQATTINPRYVLAYSNMGRLLILEGHSLEALRALDSGIDASSNDPYEDVAAYKNRGWANLELGFLKDAESDLNHSLTLKPTAAAECLIAKMFDRSKEEAKSAAAWSSFRTLYKAQKGDSDTPAIEPDCLRIAEQKQ